MILNMSACCAAPIVLDPVMVSTSGSLLLTDDSIETLIDALLPVCTLLTPNLPEARQIAEHAKGFDASVLRLDPDLKSLASRLTFASAICALGPQAVLVKGGHTAMSKNQFETALRDLADFSAGHSSPAPRFQGGHDGNALSTGARVTSGRCTLTNKRIDVVRADAWPNSLFLETLFAGNGDVAEDYEVVVDVLYESTLNKFTCFVKRRIDKSCTHGTGCTLSSALAAHMSVRNSAQSAQSPDLAVDVWKSINYVQATIMRGYEELGSGPGALDHAAVIQPRGVLSSTVGGLHGKDGEVDGDVTASLARLLDSSRQRLGTDPTPFTTQLISESLPLWERYVWHPFVQAMSSEEGLTAQSGSQHPSLPLPSFTHFLKQDYHFLLHYSRVWSLAATQYSHDFRTSQLYNTLASAMAFEASSHVRLCEAFFDISRKELECEIEGTAVISYTRFVLDVGRLGELHLLTATLPCLLGYAEMGARLKRKRQQSAASPAHPGLQQWLDLYTGEEYTQAAKAGLAHIERVAERQRPSIAEMRALQGIWDAAVKLESALWDECAARRGEA